MSVVLDVRKYRHSFCVYVIDQNEAKRQIISDILSSIHYTLVQHSDVNSALAEFIERPPHFIILDGFFLKNENFLEKILSICPETQVIAMVEQGEEKKYFYLFPYGLYEVLSWPLIDVVQLIRCVDRMAEKNVMQYMNEQLRDQVHSLKSERMKEPSTVQENSSFITQTEINNDLLSFTEKINELLETIKRLGESEMLSQVIEQSVLCAHQWTQQPVLFFKYLPARKSIFLAHGAGIDPLKYNGVGIDFSSYGNLFHSSVLKSCQDLPEINDLMRSVFNIEKFFAYSLVDDETIQGIVIVAGEVDLNVLSFLLLLFSYFKRTYHYFLLKGRLHSLETQDAVTQVWNRENFDNRLRHEMARARRTRLPVSLVRISVDRFNHIKSTDHSENVGLLLRSLAGIIKHSSRVNDIVGRLGEDEIGLLLPHTQSRGAAIKAERLRRVIESADFSKVTHQSKGVTVSMGVSEYPSFCRDSEELYHSADEALSQVKQAGMNKVCLSAPPAGFQPDFEVDLG